MGLEPQTLRSIVTHSSEWVSQTLQPYRILGTSINCKADLKLNFCRLVAQSLVSTWTGDWAKCIAPKPVRTVWSSPLEPSHTYPPVHTPHSSFLWAPYLLPPPAHPHSSLPTHTPALILVEWELGGDREGEMRRAVLKLSIVGIYSKTRIFHWITFLHVLLWLCLAPVTNCFYMSKINDIRPFPKFLPLKIES